MATLRGPAAAHRRTPANYDVISVTGICSQQSSSEQVGPGAADTTLPLGPGPTTGIYHSGALPM